MAKYIDKSALVAEIERLVNHFKTCQTLNSYEDGLKEGRLIRYEDALYKINALKVKEVDLEKELDAYTADNFWALEGNNESPYLVEKDDMLKVAKHFYELGLRAKDVSEIIKTAEDHAYFAGSENTRKNLWHPADGDDLPEIDREVIALLSNGKVVYAHRPQEYWDGKNIATGEVTRYYPERYDKGGWNQPDVKWWLDLDLPKMEE